MDDVNLPEPLHPDWRQIPLEKIDWRRNGISKTGHTMSTLYRHSTGPGRDEWDERAWYGWTLGQLADAGEEQWARVEGLGRVCILIIKEIIDRAAAGVDVTATHPTGAPYQPRPWPREE
jgi:hypothetical protein